MADRLVPGLSKSIPLASLSLETAESRRRRRAFAAFATGAALFAAGWVTLQADLAGAAGDRPGFLSFLSDVLGARPGNVSATPLVEIPIDPTPPRKAVKRKPMVATPLATRRPVCVRLCDGYFFPLSSPGRASPDDEQAACASLCPDASTALYFLPAGSDKIEDASSTSGARYAALASALRYRTTRDNACTCHATIASSSPYWQDPTLRKGDAVMTASGFMVYRGAPHSPFGRDNFARLADASMPRDRRAELMAIERVSALPARAADRPQIVAAAPSARAGGGNAIRFVERAASATN